MEVPKEQQPVPSGDRNMSRRNFLAVGGLGAIGLTAAACSIGSTSSGPLGKAPNYDTSYTGFVLNPFVDKADDSLVRIQQSGTLQIGQSNDAPYAYVDSSTGIYTGMDGDIVQFIMKMLKIQAFKITTVTFDGLIPGLLSKRYDIIGDSLHFTPARAQECEFSFPTYYYSEWLLFPKGSPLIHTQTLQQLRGHTIGTILGSNYVDFLNAAGGITVKTYTAPLDLITDLRNGRLEGALDDLPAAAIAAKNPSNNLVLGDSYQPQQLKNPAGYSRHLLRREDLQLRDAWSRCLQWMQDNGEVKKILDKYGLPQFSN
jgi:polar amino acid transport system substrate-binding protein